MDGRNLFKGAHGTVNSVRITAFVSTTMGRKRRAVRQKRQKGEARFRRKPRLIDKIAEGVAMGLSGPGARFSKVPIINGPGKLSPSTLKIEVSIVLHLT